MDVFFCDLCGVRVTDADLRSGQGQRSKWDVICASCLEQGLGKEWLGKRASSRRAAVGATEAGDRVATIDAVAPAAAAIAAAAPEPEPELNIDESVVKLTIPEDVVDADEDEDLQASRSPADILAAAPPSLDDVDADDDHAATTDSDEGFNSTAKVQTIPDPEVDAPIGAMSAAANAFSALGNMPTPSKNGRAYVEDDEDQDVDDDEVSDDDDDDLVDRAYQTPAEQLSPANGTPALGDSPFSAAGLGHPEKDETAMVPALPGTEEADLDLAPSNEAKKPSTGTSSRRKTAAKGTSSRITKPSKGKSSRSRTPKGNDHSKTILYAGIGLLVVIVIGFGVVMASKGSKGPAPKSGQTSTEAITSQIKSAEKKAVEALRSKSMPEMQSALAGLVSAQEAVYAFEDRMKADGNSQAQIDGFMDSLHLSDTMMLKKSLGEEIFKQQQQH